MRETEAFKKYQKTAKFIDAVSKITAIVAFLTVLTASIVGIIMVDKMDVTLCFYLAIGGAMVLAVVAVPLSFISQRKTNTVKLCRSYLVVLCRNPKNAVEEIHEALGTPRENIVSDFVRLNKMGLLAELYIDSEQKIVNSGVAESRIFDCPVCGGKTEIKAGEADVCAFCGAIKEKENL